MLTAIPQLVVPNISADMSHARDLAPRVLLDATGLAKGYGGRVVLNGVNVTLREGEVVLLRGDNGSGKTTLLNILSGNSVPDRGAIRLSASVSEETFRFPRRWWQKLNPADHFLPERVARHGFGRTWQETRLFSTIPLVDNVAVADPRHPGENPLNVLFRPSRVRAAEVAAQAAAETLLETLGLQGRARSSADMVSLGQTKRVAIARAARAGGSVLFLDEPLSGLDGGGIQAVVALLRELAAAHNMTLVIIEHVWNAQHILGFATTLWTLRDGELTVEAVDSRAATDVNEPHRAAVETLQQLVVGLPCVGRRLLSGGGRLSVYRHLERGQAATPLLDVEGLVVRRGRRSVIGDEGPASASLSGLNLRLSEGDLAVLEAPNGWGKTTLFEALAGLIPVSLGHVRMLGADLTRNSPWERARSGLHLLRSSGRQFPSLTVEEAFELCGGRGCPASLNHLRSQDVRQLSGGEQQAVSVAQMTMSNKRVYLLDEPFSALDAPHVAETIEAIRGLARREGTAVLVAVPFVSGVSNGTSDAISQVSTSQGVLES